MSSDDNAFKKPGLVVFDLDYTLWPFWVDTHVNPPFMVKGSKIVDATGKTIKHYPEVPDVLNYLQKEGIPIGVASRTTDPAAANQLLDLLGWDKYFTYKEIYPGCKVHHFKVFQNKSGVNYHDMIFFDDEHRNIHDITKIGAQCVLIKEDSGVTMKLVQEALNEFPKKHHHR